MKEVSTRTRSIRAIGGKQPVSFHTHGSNLFFKALGAYVTGKFTLGLPHAVVVNDRLIAQVWELVQHLGSL